MKRIITLSSLFIAFIFISSCEKKGCIDPLAKNYDSSAKANDGSCNYQGQVVIWQDEAYAQSAIDAGTTTFKFYIGGNLVGSMASSTYAASAPTCGANGFVTITQDLGANDSKSITVDVKDESDDDITSYNITFKGGKCVPFQLQ